MFAAYLLAFLSHPSKLNVVPELGDMYKVLPICASPSSGMAMSLLNGPAFIGDQVLKLVPRGKNKSKEFQTEGLSGTFW
jgi:hypothetical protein